MSLKFDQKEDLRLRMADLEKKLAESEEERCKLEKTCNVLMRAFREEEKMQYEALNQKYEKFLEDCTVRKRRNNIILRSLCRIEDRSRALFAKTERLKLLKDRYISYLNLSDYRKGEIHSYSSWGTLPFASPRRKITNVAPPKYVQWTTPLATHLKTERLRNAVRDLLEESKASEGDPRTNESVEKFQEEKRWHEGRKPSGINVYNGITNTEEGVRSPRVGDIPNPAETGYDSYGREADFVPEQTEKLAWNRIVPGNHTSENDEPDITPRDKKVVDYHGSERLKMVLPSEGKHQSQRNDVKRHDQSEGENAYIEQKDSITKENNPKDALFPRTDYNWASEEKEEEEEGEVLRNQKLEFELDPQPDYPEDGDASPESSKSLPKGLDGVDYQNETYPESYYEQPVHQNHASIASDVILEEDESEQDLDEEEKNFTPGDSFRETRPKESGGQSPGHGAVDEPQLKTETNKQSEEPRKGHASTGGQIVDEVRSRGSESEKSLEGKQSDKSERSEEKWEKKKSGVRSNLIHLLESDSESFQIEHGDAISGNEDSDFDFSFHQN